MPEFTEWQVGRFVKVPRWGFGKLRFVDSSEATVEFFRSSAEDGRFDRALPLDQVVLENPPSGVRCFFFEHGWWRAGRLLWVVGDDCGVTTDDDRRTILAIDRVYVRCRVALDDPTEVIAGGALQHPGYATGRRGFVTELLHQRAAGRGMTGLVSSRIRLFPHQVELCSRIQRDSVQRYLLADEVGLGKTIEAGVILRQYLLDHPSGTAVLLAPRLLIGQWRRELKTKFGIEDLNLGAHRVRYVEHAHLDWWEPGPGLVIVDEAHHLAAGFGSADASQRQAYEELRRAALETKRLLLLSATPLLHNERNFLAMLHLLDPVLYPLEGLEEFIARVVSRRPFALRLQAFTPDAPEFVLEEHAEAFRELFPIDNVLRSYLDALLEAIDTQDPEKQAAIVQSARIHLGETYRLHQRVLRTRRNSPLAHDFPVRGRKLPEHLAVTRAHDDELDTWLSAWLDLVSVRLAGSRLEGALLIAVTGLLDRWRAAPQVLSGYISAWLCAGQDATADAELSPTESHALAEIALANHERARLLELVEMLESDASFGWLSQVVEHIRNAPEKTVVFCAHFATAVILADELDRQVVPRRVARYLHDSTDLDRLEEQLEGFQEGRAPYLVCDRAAEEGCNFQFAAAAFHVDLPWNPNRLEQRIGRLDRLGDPDAVPSLVITTHGSVDDAWLHLLTDGYGLFDDSIASLQHVLEGTVREAVQRLIDHGLAGLASLAPDLRESLERERREIEQLENLEAIEGESVFGRGLFESLQAGEDREGDLERRTDGWLCLTRRSPEGIGLELRPEPERPSVRSYFLDPRADPGMPRELIRRHLGNYLGRGHRCTFWRATACEIPGVALMRPGEAFFDAIEDLTREDDLGQTFGFWRRYPLLEEPLLAAGLTFRVEADIDRGARLLAEAGAGPDQNKALQRTVDGFFPPQGVTVWLDRDGRAMTQDRVLTKLSPPFNHRSDVELGSGHIEHLERMFGLDWKKWWTTQAEVAHDLVAGQATLAERRRQGISDAKTAYEYARDQQRLRLGIESDTAHRRRAEDDLAMLDKLEQAVITAIEGAVPIPEAVGVVILAREPTDELFA